MTETFGVYDMPDKRSAELFDYGRVYSKQLTPTPEDLAAAQEMVEEALSVSEGQGVTSKEALDVLSGALSHASDTAARYTQHLVDVAERSMPKSI